jgi:hypothetical protein
MQERQRHREMVRPAYECLLFAKEALEKRIPGIFHEEADDLRRQLPKIEFALSAAVDMLWAKNNLDEMREISSDYFDAGSAFFEQITNVSLEDLGRKKSENRLTSTYLLNFGSS